MRERARQVCTRYAVFASAALAGVLDVEVARRQAQAELGIARIGAKGIARWRMRYAGARTR